MKNIETNVYSTLAEVGKDPEQDKILLAEATRKSARINADKQEELKILMTEDEKLSNELRKVRVEISHLKSDYNY